MGRKTYCVANMKFTDVTALSDASVSSSDNQDIGNLELFQNETEYRDYCTLELNQFILDGTKEAMEGQPQDICFLSKQKSDTDCNLTESPKLTITFTENHTSAGITLYFGKYYPAEIAVTWYTLSGLKIESKTYKPKQSVFFCKNQVQNYGKIELAFNKTELPGRYARAQFILYGVELSWEDDLIKTAKVREEMDLTSATLAINTAEISIVDVNNDFDIENDDGAWKSVQKIQEVTLGEFRNGAYQNVGTFFVDTMSFQDNEATFELIDRIGLMDNNSFSAGKIYQKEKAGSILVDIFSKANVTKYLISDDVFNIELSGCLKKQTCREALQMVCFACGAVADDSRSDYISIYKPGRYVDTYIGPDRKFYGSSKVELDEYVSGVQIEYSQYSLESEAKEIYNDELPEGDSKIEFTELYEPESILVSAGEVKVATTDYVVVTMAAASQCIVTGRKYSSNTLVYSLDSGQLEAGQTENIKKFGTCTLYNLDTLKNTAKYLLDYYGLRKVVELEYLLEDEQVGSWAGIRDTKGNTAITAIESQDIDLTGGFIASAKCRGYSRAVTNFAYTGEFYSGERGLI